MVRPRHPKIATLVSHLFYAGRLLTPSSVTQDPGMNMEGIPQVSIGWFMENPHLKWMITGGNPILGNHRIGESPSCQKLAMPGGSLRKSKKEWNVQHRDVEMMNKGIRGVIPKIALVQRIDVFGWL